MSVSINPVLARELKERMRGLWAFVALMVFLGLLTLTVWLVYQANQLGDEFSFDLERQTRVGRDLYEWMLGIMVLLVCFLVPGLTAGAIAGERERQTLLPLQITLLRPRQILWGKVMASLAYLTLMAVAAMPIFAVAYHLGGVSLLDTVKGLACVLVVGMLLATMIVGISAYAKRVQTATLLAYGFTAVLLLGSFVLYGTVGVIDDNRGIDATNPPAILLTPNPLVFLADATAGENVAVGSSPMRPLRELLVRSYAENGGWFGGDGIAEGFAGDFDGDFVAPGGFQDGIVVDQFGNQIGRFDQESSPTRGGFPGWAISLASCTLLAAIMFALGCRRLRTPADTER